MSQATDRLAASVARCSASVDALVSRFSNLPAPPNDEAAVNAAADALDALSAKVDATVPTVTA